MWDLLIYRGFLKPGGDAIYDRDDRTGTSIFGWFLMFRDLNEIGRRLR